MIWHVTAAREDNLRFHASKHKGPQHEQTCLKLRVGRAGVQKTANAVALANRAAPDLNLLSLLVCLPLITPRHRLWGEANLARLSTGRR
eukprot:1836810-Amphidinium_carterae.1